MNMRLILVAGVLAAASLPLRAADVAVNYTKQCASCHAKDGSANTKAGKLAGAKDLRDPKIQAEFTDEKGFKAIKEGIKDGDKVKMKPAKDLTDDEIKELVAYVRKFKK